MGRTGMRLGIGVMALGLLTVLAGDPAKARAQAKKSDAVVKMDVQADRPDADGKQTITILLAIEKPWHIYANPVDNEDLANVQTDVKIASRGKLDDVKVSYPDGKLYQDKGDKYKIYEGKVAIKAQVKRAKGDSSPVEVSVKLQACNDKTCLFPVTLKKELP